MRVQVLQHVPFEDIGLQFHLETTPESVGAILDNCARDLTPGPCVQTEDEIWGVAGTACTGINCLMSELLSYITRPKG